MKGFIGFAVGIILVVCTGIYLSSRDPIGVEVARASADMTVGNAVVNDLQQGFNIVMTWMLGATFVGVGTALFVEVRKNYRRWFLSQQTRRWQSGPNARWQQQQPAQRAPNLSRNDMLMMTLMSAQNKLQNFSTRFGPKRSTRQDAAEEELNIDL